ncbi:MAG: DUF4250 domain-containing protein [Lachnospiraceae bacterium]|nr:DUF4250 domain-containing protein [Lachnospiraceae bacterium]
MSIPNDPFILLSYVNTQLRDFYPSLSELGKSLDVNINDIREKLSAVGFEYNAELNKFM